MQSFWTADLLTGYAHESEQVINAGLIESLIASCVMVCWKRAKRELTFEATVSTSSCVDKPAPKTHVRPAPTY